MKKLLSAVLVLTMLLSAVCMASAEDKPFNGEKVVVGVVTYTGALPGMARISEKLTEYTMEKYGLAVELQCFGFADYNQSATLMLTSGEQLDIFTALLLGYTASVNKDFTLDLEENDLMANYGKGILANVPKDYLDAARINGVLYGVPNMKDNAVGQSSFAIGAKYLDGIGYDYASKLADGAEIIYTDMAEINDIFAKLHEAFPDLYVFAPLSNLTQYMFYDPIGGDPYGVLLDPVNSLQVENLFASQVFHDYCKQVYDWNQAGYISKDALTSDVTGSQCVKAGTAMSYPTATKPGIKAQESGLSAQEMIIFQTGADFTSSSGIAGMPWCINSNTEIPEAAMTILDGFYSDPVMSNLLCWGEEGVEYQKMEDGHITFADGIDANNSEWYTSVNWEMPNQFIAHIWNGDTLDLWERMAKFNNESLLSKASGFTFDNSEVAAEYTALTSVYDEYITTLLFGFVDPDDAAEGIPAFVEALTKNGLDTYMAAKQTALDAWAAAK